VTFSPVAELPEGGKLPRRVVDVATSVLPEGGEGVQQRRKVGIVTGTVFVVTVRTGTSSRSGVFVTKTRRAVTKRGDLETRKSVTEEPTAFHRTRPAELKDRIERHRSQAAFHAEQEVFHQKGSRGQGVRVFGGGKLRLRRL
jgi:hypothetical protein